MEGFQLKGAICNVGGCFSLALPFGCLRAVVCSGCTLLVFFEMMLFLLVYKGFFKSVTGGHQTRGGFSVDGGNL